MWIELAAGCDQILCNILVNVHLFSIHWWNSPGVMLLIFKRASGHVPLKILSIEDGTVLRNFNHLLHRNQKVDFIEQFNEKLLVKQENENLQILDVRSPFLPVKTRQFFSCHFLFIETICFHIIWAQKKSEQPSFYNSLSLSLSKFSIEDPLTHERKSKIHRPQPLVIILSLIEIIPIKNLQVRNSQLTQVSRTEFTTPSAFIFLYENQLFLTFRNRTVAVWNFRGELVTTFDDHLLWHPDCNTNNIYITTDQDLIISYCKAKSDDDSPDRNGN